MPITDELREMVGNPCPSTDLAVRARRRGVELRRRRLAVTTSAVVAVGVLAVPAFLPVGGQSRSVSAAAGAGGVSKPTVAPQPSTGPAKPLVLSTSTPLAVVDRKRVAAAKGLLGATFTQLDAGVLLDADTGAAVGTSATFQATDGGGTVGITWSDIQQGTAVAVGGSSVSGVGALAITASAAASAPVSVDAPKRPAATSVDPAVEASPDLLGDVSADGKTIISLKVVQGEVGSPPILAGSAGPAFVTQLLKLSA